MVLEAAVIRVKEGMCNEFESQFRKASHFIARAEGYVEHELHKCVEEPDQYLMLVKWQSISDPIAGFRKSEDFREWQAMLEPYCAEPPAGLYFVKIRL